MHSFTDGHFHCFHSLSIVSNAAVNMGVQISFRDNGFISSLIFLIIENQHKVLLFRNTAYQKNLTNNSYFIKIRLLVSAFLDMPLTKNVSIMHNIWH